MVVRRSVGRSGHSHRIVSLPASGRRESGYGGAFAFLPLDAFFFPRRRGWRSLTRVQTNGWHDDGDCMWRNRGAICWVGLDWLALNGLWKATPGQAISNTREFCNVHRPADVSSISICDQVGSNEPKPIYKLCQAYVWHTFGNVLPNPQAPTSLDSGSHVSPLSPFPLNIKQSHHHRLQWASI